MIGTLRRTSGSLSLYLALPNDTLINLLTTGYGHQSPLSAEGKSFCIIYALIGIPMTLLLLTAVVERLLRPIGLALRFLNNRLGHRYTALTIRILHLSLVKIRLR